MADASDHAEARCLEALLASAPSIHSWEAWMQHRQSCMMHCLGESHPSTMAAMDLHAALLQHRGQWRQALYWQRNVLSIQCRNDHNVSAIVPRRRALCEMLSGNSQHYNLHPWALSEAQRQWKSSKLLKLPDPPDVSWDIHFLSGESLHETQPYISNAHPEDCLMRDLVTLMCTAWWL